MIAAAAMLLVARAVVAFVLWKPGWSALTWDDFTRVALAQQWAMHPFIAQGDMVWLPLQTWIYGIGLAVTDGAFSDNPMLLATLINSVAAVGAAALVGRAACLLFGSPAGGLLVFATILFAPWAVFTSLSALSEPLYYCAIALAVWALAARQNGGGLGPVAVGSLGVASAAALRYEGWLLAPVWIVVVAVSLLPATPSLSPASVGRAWWGGRTALVVTAAPLLVPAGWMALHAARQGSAFAFSAATAGMFASSLGAELFGTLRGRLVYYPAGLLRSAPLLLPLLVALAILGARHVPQSRLLTGLVTLHFGLFYVTSLVSNSIGAFTERFMFAFVLALAPLLSMVPGLLEHVRRWPTRVALTAALLALLVVETAHGLAHRSDEWAHAPDLLEVTTILGDAARTRVAPLRVLVGDGLANDLMPLHVQNGRRLSITPAPGARVEGVVPNADVRIERLPDRIATIPQQPAAIVGRFYLYGAVSVSPRAAGETLGEWRRVDENGVATAMTPSRFVGLEFTGDNPPPGAEAIIERLVPRRGRPQRGSLALRWMYGHGFNLGRILVEVRVDGRVVFRTDIGAPNHWQTTTFEIPAGMGSSTVAVAVRATERIETNWDWGRASTVIAKDFAITPLGLPGLPGPLLDRDPAAVQDDRGR